MVLLYFRFDKEFQELESHRCVGCMDVFPSLYTLQDHQARQSYTLTLDCPDCKRRLAYHNKCAMYTHLISHHRTDLSQCQRIARDCCHIAILPRNFIKSAKNAGAKTEALVNGHHTTAHDDASARLEDDSRTNDQEINDGEIQPRVKAPEDAVQENADIGAAAADEPSQQVRLIMILMS